MTFTAHEKRDCARRELDLRKFIYQNRIETGRMTRQKADRELALMREIADDYDKLANAERLI